MVLLSNDAMVHAFFMMKFEKIVDAMTEEVYAMLQDSIMDKVYNPHEPKYYQRQGLAGLLGAWNRKTTHFGSTIESLIKHTPETMKLDPEEFIHGSNYWIKDDIREELADIITQGLSGPLFGNGWWRRKRDFWSSIYKKFEGTWIDRRFQQGMIAQGIKFRKI